MPAGDRSVPMTSFVAAPTVRGAVITGALCVVLTMTRPVAEWFFLVPLALSLVVVTGWRRRAAIAGAMIAWSSRSCCHGRC